jgi:hypothetical protein
MPFTLSHPAILLPIKYLPSRYYSWTGLIIGSLVPDFEYFIRMKMLSIFSHTLSGLFWFDIPLSLLLTVIFHNIVRDELIDNLPNYFKSTLIMYKDFHWIVHLKYNWVIILGSIFIGSISHLLWDSFTHYHGYFVQNIVALKYYISLSKYQMPVYKILQHGSSLIGMILIVRIFYKMPSINSGKSKSNATYWSIYFTTVSISIFMAIQQDIQIGGAIITLISANILSLIFTPIFLTLLK